MCVLLSFPPLPFRIRKCGYPRHRDPWSNERTKAHVDGSVGPVMKYCCFFCQQNPEVVYETNRRRISAPHKYPFRFPEQCNIAPTRHRNGFAMKTLFEIPDGQTANGARKAGGKQGWVGRQGQGRRKGRGGSGGARGEGATSEKIR